jgi:hypothetical protein
MKSFTSILLTCNIVTLHSNSFCEPVISLLFTPILAGYRVQEIHGVIFLIAMEYNVSRWEKL